MEVKKKENLKKNRGGSWIIKLENKNGILTANRNPILGLNIPCYE